MMDTQNVLTAVLPAVVLLPIAGAVGTVSLSRISERVRGTVLSVVCLLQLGLIALLIPGVLDGEVYHLRLMQITPTIWLDLKADAMGTMFAVTVSMLWLMAVIYSCGYMADEHRLNRYFSFLMLALAWTSGVAFSGNLLTFLIFYELFSILTYPLVVHEETPEAMAAGTKYIIYILVGGGLVLIAILFTYFMAGTGMLDSAGILSIEEGRTALIAVFWCFVAGFGVKAALVPLHGWVPDAHPAAPAPFSAVLSGVMVATGSFGILRVMYNVFGVELLRELGVMDWVGYLAAFTVLFAAVLALGQDNLKRRLAYSTISQMGYVIMGAALMHPEATTGALVHIANHAFMKGTLFLCAGLLIKRMNVSRVSQMAGIAKQMPITMAAFTIATLAMIGTPPLSGFISKWYLGLGMVEADKPWYLVVLLAGALLAACYLLPIVYTAYFKEPRVPFTAEPALKTPREAPWTMLGPTVIGAALVVVLGMMSAVPGLPLSLAKLAVKSFFG